MFSVCALDSDPRSAAVYSDIFSSRRASLMVFSAPHEALEYIESKPLDLIIGALQLSDESLLEFVDTVRRKQPEAALLIMHPGLCVEDVATLKGCGVQAVAPDTISALAYREAIGGSVEAFFDSGGPGPQGPPGGRVTPVDSLFTGGLDLDTADIIDKTAGLRPLPEAPDESLISDARRMAEAVKKVDSRSGLSVFEEEVQEIGKSRAAAALLYLCEITTSPEQVWLMVRFLSFIPSYTTKLALERLSKKHPNARVRDSAKKGCKALLRKFPIIFHAERLLSIKTGPSVVSKAAESIAKCDSELAVDLLTYALAVKRQNVQNAAIRGLGMVGTERALGVIYRRLRIFRLVRETAFLQDSCDSQQHLRYMKSLATILKTTNGEHPDAAQEVALELRSDDKMTKLKAIEIIGLSRTPSCCEMLSTLIKSPDWRIRTSVLRAIARCPSPDAIDAIRDFVSDPNHTISNLAMEALERLRMKDEIRKTFQEGRDRVRASAAAALGRLTDEESLSELMALAFDDDRDVAHGALKRLARIADSSCVPELERLLSRSSRPEIVADAAFCLGKIASDRSLEVLIEQAKMLIRSADFRLPLLVRAIGTAINSERWRRNDTLMAEALSLFQQVGVVSSDAVELEIAGILLHIKGLNLRSYDKMLLLLEKFAVRRPEPTPQQCRLVSISRKAIRCIRKKKLRLHELEKTLDRTRQVIESLPARADGERHRMFAALGNQLSALPIVDRRNNAVAVAGIDALLCCLNDPNAAWPDRASAIKSLSMIGEPRALPMLRELKRSQDVHSIELATRAIRSIIKKNLRARRAQETQPEPEKQRPNDKKPHASPRSNIFSAQSSARKAAAASPAPVFG